MLEGKTALVTGSTRNTGLGIARTLLGYGSRVFVNGRSEQAVERAIGLLAQEAPGRVFGAPGDIAREEAVTEIFASIADRAGRLEILVNNACLLGQGYDAVSTPGSFFDEVMSVNVRGTFLCCREAARMMTEARSGAIVNIGSVVAGRATRRRLAYVASKGAIEAMTRALALELAPAGVRVNCVLPGYIHTERWEEISEAARATRRDNIPLGMEATARDVAEAVAFLASERSGNITGAMLTVNGGMDIQLVPSGVDV